MQRKNLPATILLFVLLTTSAGLGHTSAPLQELGPIILGHRGSSDNYPENTMLAFRQAITEGAHGIELDVRRSLDGVYLVMHDATLDRTTDGSGRVADRTWEYISRLDAGRWRGEQFAQRLDTKVPTLLDVLTEWQDTDVVLSLHIKLGLDAMLDIAEMVENLAMQDQVLFFASAHIIGAFKQQKSHLFVINDGRSHPDFAALLARAKAEQWNGISWRQDDIQPQMVAAAAEAGLLLQASYLSRNYLAETKALLDMGVDIILGDDSEKMMEAYRRFRLMDPDLPLRFTIETAIAQAAADYPEKTVILFAHSEFRRLSSGDWQSAGYASLDEALAAMSYLIALHQVSLSRGREPSQWDVLDMLLSTQLGQAVWPTSTEDRRNP